MSFQYQVRLYTRIWVYLYAVSIPAIVYTIQPVPRLVQTYFITSELDSKASTKGVMTLDYTNENYKFNNESPWSMNTSEIMFLLADNGVRQDTTTRPALKCWIPTLMGPTQTPLPRITYSGIPKNHFINSNECKLPISNIIHFQNYITVPFGDHDYYYHRWINHGSELWGKVTNYSIDEIYVDTNFDPSYCDSCASQHPWYTNEHAYNPNWHCRHP